MLEALVYHQPPYFVYAAVFIRIEQRKAHSNAVLCYGIGQRVFKRGCLGKRNIVAGYELLLILIHG